MKYPYGQCEYQATRKENLYQHKRSVHEGRKENWDLVNRDNNPVDLKEDEVSLLVSDPPDEVTCSICCVQIDAYIPDYFCGEKINPACQNCKGEDDTQCPDPFKSFPDFDIPPTLISHWIPTFYKFDRSRSDLTSISTLRSHYVRLPNPGDYFTANEEIMQEFRILLNKQHQSYKEECRQS